MAFVRRVSLMATVMAVGIAIGAVVFGAGNVLAAITNRIGLTPDQTFVNQSVSFDTTPGRLVSSRAVPQGHYWELQTLRATNCEAEPRAMEFLLIDQDGTTHAVLSLQAANPAVVPPDGALAWTGSVTVPPGWKVAGRWHGMAGGARCNWQYTAVERATG